jgi:hypothetical protein
MVLARRARPQRGRKSTPSLQRVLAALVALLLSASALGQAAHFLLVPHALCAEHGELLELSERGSHGAAAHEQAAGSVKEAHASPPDAVAAHDHCDVLARGQREQGLPKAAAALQPAAPFERATFFAAQRVFSPGLPALALAPKTSPPRRLGC